MLLLSAAVLLAGVAPPASAAPAPPAAPPGPPADSWRWPLAGRPRVVGAFRPPESPWSAGHRGVDLLADPGTPVYASGPGRIGFAGRVAGRGVVSTIHGALRTTYLPVIPLVVAGQTVRAGSLIATVEADPTHCPHRACLHWGLLRGTVYLNPLALVGRVVVRLLPVWEHPPPDRPAHPALAPSRLPPPDVAPHPPEPPPAVHAGPADRAGAGRSAPAAGRAGSGHLPRQSDLSGSAWLVAASAATGSGLAAVAVLLLVALARRWSRAGRAGSGRADPGRAGSGPRSRRWRRRSSRRPAPLPPEVVDLARERARRRAGYEPPIPA